MRVREAEREGGREEFGQDSMSAIGPFLFYVLFPATIHLFVV